MQAQQITLYLGAITMITLNISQTAKGYHPEDEWQHLDSQTEYFRTIQEATAWLKEQYGNCKRVKMYRDLESGGSVHSGYVYGFRNSDISHLPVAKWIQQDWVAFIDSQPMNLN